MWVKASDVHANDYNPNSVAPPEMELLKVSILSDGYTQPIVAMPDENGQFEVIDGFHRNRCGKEDLDIKARVCGYLPIVKIKEDRTDKSDRIAATIRHNRARGKHRVDAMSDIVVELKRRNWSDEKISRELGMDQDEILRLCQITGLADLFQDQEFSKSWDIEGEITEKDFEELSDDVSTYGEEAEKFRTVNTSDENRIFHTYEKWECYKAGFYATTKEGMTKAECEEEYRKFLSDVPKFEATLGRVITEWKNSCDALGRLTKSLSELGNLQPITWNAKTGNIVGGHQRLKCYQALQKDEVEVWAVWLDEAQEKAANIALNKLSGEFDLPQLKDLIEELDTGEIDLDVIGFGPVS